LSITTGANWAGAKSSSISTSSSPPSTPAKHIYQHEHSVHCETLGLHEHHRQRKGFPYPQTIE
jgi:Na+/phosphate symporter